MSKPLHIIILAAGEGKRMHSQRPKVLQALGGRPLLDHVLETAANLQPEQIQLVYGHGGDQLREVYAATSVHWVEQSERRGTGHATGVALDHIPDHARVLVLYGDVPLMPLSDLQALLAVDADLVILSAKLNNPHGYGRIIRQADGSVSSIIEERDADDAQRAITEINTGVITAKAGRLRHWLGQVSSANAQNEIYLTDVAAIAAGEGCTVQAVIAARAEDCLGANDRAQLADLEQRLQWRYREQLLNDGVGMADPATVYIRGQVGHGRDVWLDVGVILEQDIHLGDGVQIGAGSVLKNCRLAAGTIVAPYSVLQGVITHGPCQIGPFARLRPGTELSAGCKIGNFVETKKVHLGEGSKASHLTYLGDATIGAGVNIGAGTITCNYDGVNKHQTVIKDGAFIGSNAALVAPVTIGESVLVGAGSTITRDVEDEHLVVTRAPQRAVRNRRPRKKK